MKKNTIDYFEDVDVQEHIEIESALEFSDIIEQRLNVKGRKSKQTIKEINEQIDEYNRKFGATYRRI